MTFKETLTRRWPWFAGGGLLTVVVIAVLVAALAGVFSSSEPEPAPRASAEIATPTTPAPEPEVDIETVQTMPYSPVWNPPDAGENFWQVVDPENGYPEDGGTDYVLAHACEDQGCAGDEVRTLDAGDELTYRGEPYVVEEKLEIAKTEIADQDIWTHDPARLVVITCILDPETGEYHENDIIVATRAA
ncbi:hypothetical protein JL108_06610 [Aeromicrobium sp. YIM 150415]|uniref:Sortase n=1 Tax=Aeromicrobium piscarium TaxID=2590901 RepID=A0A554RUU8_9ACTN|nr:MULTISPECIES: hypothetical protein [Aeromicrobium]MBM9463116.1 hypothetical protein [Aeromicrobium sp. YIM 150415]TSD57830.1 hypothetical protein FNM00_15520 [Aeromicrobium piscarium]